MYGCVSRTIKKAERWRIDAFESTLESPLDCKEIQPVNLKWNQPWIFIRRTDAEMLILCPPNVKNWLIGKDPDTGKDWRQEEKGTTKDEVVGWHHHLNGHESEQAWGDGEGQRSLSWCSPWGHRVRHDWVNNNSYFHLLSFSFGSFSAFKARPKPDSCLVNCPLCIFVSWLLHTGTYAFWLTLHRESRLRLSEAPCLGLLSTFPLSLLASGNPVSV